MPAFDKKPDAGPFCDAGRPALTSDAPIIEHPSSVPLPNYSSSGLDGGTRPLDPIEAHRLFGGMYDDNSPPPSTLEKLNDLDTYKKAGIEQAKQDPIVKEGRKLLEKIKPSPPLGTQEPAKKTGPFDFNVSVSPSAPSVEELRESSLANPDKQARAVDAPRPADAKRTTFKEVLPDGGTKIR